MKERLEQSTSIYGPMQFKSFEGALGSFFANECPQLGGDRTRQVLVGLIRELVGRYFPETTHLSQGQIQWTAVCTAPICLDQTLASCGLLVKPS